MTCRHPATEDDATGRKSECVAFSAHAEVFGICRQMSCPQRASDGQKERERERETAGVRGAHGGGGGLDAAAFLTSWSERERERGSSLSPCSHS